MIDDIVKRGNVSEYIDAVEKDKIVVIPLKKKKKTKL